MSLIYGVEFNNQTRALSFSDRAGNNIYSCTIPASHPLTFVSTEDGSTIWLFGYNAARMAQYEVDTGNGWTPYSISDKPHLTLNRGESCRWRCSNRRGVQTASYYVNFGMTGSFEACGNIHSMLVPNFENITSLADYPYAFYNLFKKCTSLKKAPVLPATTLSEGCYRGLFDGSGIVHPPKLPATTLANSCYRSLFANCASLTQCTDLPATTLVQSCYQYLYYNAPLLAEAKIAATDITASDALSNWLMGSASVGNIFCDPTLSYPKGTSGIPKGWERWVYGATDTGETTTMYHNGTAETVRVGTSSYGVCYSAQGWAGFRTLAEMHALGYTFGEQTAVTMYNYDEQITAYSCAASNDDGFTETMYDTGSGKGYLDIVSQNDDGFYFESTPWTGLTLTATADNSSVLLMKGGPSSSSSSLNSTFEVNRGSGWNAYKYNATIYLNNGESCKFRCSYYDVGTNYQRRPQFVMTGTIEASGNCYSMLSKSFESITDLHNDRNSYYLGHLFEDCTSLTKAPELPATTLVAECYFALFKNTRLTKTPLLPATTLSEGCYWEMFSGSGSLKEVRIAATTLASNALANWLKDVSLSGDFYCDPNTTYPTGADGCPGGWAIHNIANYPTT